MKKSLIITLTLLSGLSYASYNTDRPVSDCYCRGLETKAVTIMYSRQKGVSKKDTLKVTKGVDGLVSIAYNKPQYVTPDKRQKAVKRFSKWVFNVCMKEGMK